MTQARILVIDDEPGISLLCDRLLTRAGYGVIAYTDPKKALDAVDRNASTCCWWIFGCRRSAALT